MAMMVQPGQMEQLETMVLAVVMATATMRVEELVQVVQQYAQVCGWVVLVEMVVLAVESAVVQEMQVRTGVMVGVVLSEETISVRLGPI
jgi:hypothetical protein